ncbi:hypothetical protein PG984_001376 [Apiospora sp. TS-2023a]
MPSLFCCGSIKPYRPQYLLHQDKFNTFMAWAPYPQAASPVSHDDSMAAFGNGGPSFAIQLVRQVNYGPLESKRSFVPALASSSEFVEVGEDELIQANFKKLNSTTSVTPTINFEVNIYQKDPVNKHHWRANVARPASSIDL